MFVLVSFVVSAVCTRSSSSCIDFCREIENLYLFVFSYTYGKDLFPKHLKNFILRSTRCRHKLFMSQINNLFLIISTV